MTTTIAPIAYPDKLYIDGAWVAPSSTAMIEVFDSTTEEVYLRVAQAEAADIDRAVSAARSAFDDGPWPKMSHLQRAAYVHALAAELRAQADRIGQIWPREVGILHSVAMETIQGDTAQMDYYADMADTFDWVEEHEPMAGGGFGLLVREPVGVVASIIPWNGPLAVIALTLSPALVAGCTVIIKASPEAPGEAYLVAEAAEKLGLPPGVVNVVTAHREVSELLVRDPRVDKIAFTGSTAAGRRIGSILGDRVGRYTLELGGKSAAVVLDDADIAATAATLAAAECLMTGQVCCSLTRVVVSRRRHDALAEALSANFAKVVVGSPFDADTTMGPLAMSRQRDRVESMIAKGIADGAQLLTGGGRPKHLDRGYFIEPTVFGNVDNSTAIAQEEIFGPVLSVIPAQDESDAVRIANDTIYGLGSAVFTPDPERAYSVARQLRAGTVGINAFRVDHRIAFGGFKQSGVGRAGGREGLLAYTEAKTILGDSPPAAF